MTEFETEVKQKCRPKDKVGWDLLKEYFLHASCMALGFEILTIGQYRN